MKACSIVVGNNSPVVLIGYFEHWLIGVFGIMKHCDAIDLLMTAKSVSALEALRLGNLGMCFQGMLMSIFICSCCETDGNVRLFIYRKECV